MVMTKILLTAFAEVIIRADIALKSVSDYGTDSAVIACDIVVDEVMPRVFFFFLLLFLSIHDSFILVTMASVSLL